jgi:hypothetical protein
MAKGRKMRTLRKKMGGNPENLKEEEEEKNKILFLPSEPEKNKISFLPIDISKTKYKSKISKSPPLGTETIYGEIGRPITGRPIDISRYNKELPYKKKDLSTMVDKKILTEDDIIMGGKLRRTKKRRMTKRRKNSRKSRKSKSRKMRREGLPPNYFTANDLRNEYNSGFENQQSNGAQPIKQFTKEEYEVFRNNPSKYATDKPVANIITK